MVTDIHAHSACDDVPSADEVRAVVKDIWDLRLAKLRKSTDLMIRQQETHAKVRNSENMISIFGTAITLVLVTQFQ